MSKNSTSEFQGYVKASLESIKSDIKEIKDLTPKCMVRFETIEKEQSKLKGIYLGAAAVFGAVAGFISKFLSK